MKAALAAMEEVEGPITEIQGPLDVTREGFIEWTDDDWRNGETEWR